MYKEKEIPNVDWMGMQIESHISLSKIPNSKNVSRFWRELRNTEDWVGRGVVILDVMWDQE